MSRRLATALGLLLVLATLVAPSSAPAAVRAPGPGPLPEPLGVWPLDPVPTVLVGYDPPAQPWDAGHRGVDLAGTVGQSVRAALAGTVRYAGRIAGRGVVVVDHGDTRTTYEPVASSHGVGTPVAAGQHLGRLELVGSHCLPRACLHWGLRRGEKYLDPLSLVGAGPVRLLPLWRDTPVNSMLLDRPPPAEPRSGLPRRELRRELCGAALAVVAFVAGPVAGLPSGVITAAETGSPARASPSHHP